MYEIVSFVNLSNIETTSKQVALQNTQYTKDKVARSLIVLDILLFPASADFI